MLKKYPLVFEGEKKIIIYDVPIGTPSNIEKKIYDKILENNLNPNDYVLYKNSDSNVLGESLQEYLASIYFINKGYLVENQVPWFQQNYHYKNKILQGGIPDFSAFHNSISKHLYSSNIISEKGIHVCLFPVIRLFRKNLFVNKTAKNYERELLIGEAKTSNSSLPQAIKQLTKYSSVELANELFTIIPNSKYNNDFGSFYIDDNCKLNFVSRNKQYFNDERTKEDDKWISTYVKMLLLGNIPFSKIETFIDSFRNENNLITYDKYNSTHLLDAVQNTDDEIFFIFLKEAMNGLYE